MDESDKANSIQMPRVKRPNSSFRLDKLPVNFQITKTTAKADAQTSAYTVSRSKSANHSRANSYAV